MALGGACLKLSFDRGLQLRSFGRMPPTLLLSYCSCSSIRTKTARAAASKRGEVGGGGDKVQSTDTVVPLKGKKIDFKNPHCKGRPLVQPSIEQSPTINFQIYYISHCSHCDHRIQHPFRAWKPSGFLTRPMAAFAPSNQPSVAVPRLARGKICSEVGGQSSSRPKTRGRNVKHWSEQLPTTKEVHWCDAYNWYNWYLYLTASQPWSAVVDALARLSRSPRRPFRFLTSQHGQTDFCATVHSTPLYLVHSPNHPKTSTWLVSAESMEPHEYESRLLKNRYNPPERRSGRGQAFKRMDLT